MLLTAKQVMTSLHFPSFPPHDSVNVTWHENTCESVPLNHSYEFVSSCTMRACGGVVVIYMYVYIYTYIYCIYIYIYIYIYKNTVIS